MNVLGQPKGTVETTYTSTEKHFLIAYLTSSDDFFMTLASNSHMLKITLENMSDSNDEPTSYNIKLIPSLCSTSNPEYI
jgi:hypothetical protein